MKIGLKEVMIARVYRRFRKKFYILRPTVFFAWLKWCWKSKRIVPFGVGLISNKPKLEDLTKEELDYAKSLESMAIKQLADEKIQTKEN